MKYYMNEKGKVVIIIAHPLLRESRANKELVDAVKENDEVIVYDLYEQPQGGFNVGHWSRYLSEATAVVLQFPLHWMSAPYMMKRWEDEVLTYVAQTPAIVGKPLMVVTTTGAGARAYRSGGRMRFTIDEILRPYEAMSIHAGMVWQTPIVVHAAEAEDAGKRISLAANEYRERVAELIGNTKKIAIKSWA